MNSPAMIVPRHTPSGLSTEYVRAEQPADHEAADIVLSAEQIAEFRRVGYLVVEDVSTPEELEQMRVVYDGLFAKRLGWDTGDLFDLVQPDDPKRGLSLPQMLWPSRYEPYFLDTVVRRRCTSLARQILGPTANNMNEHAILKPPRSNAPTPWHQDEAFNTLGSGFIESIAMWMPLQDVNEGNGCLRYIPESNLGPLHPHHSPNNDPSIHGLETSPPDVGLAVPIPMRAGSVVIHHSMTIHGAGPNPSAYPRRSYALGFGVKTERSLLTRDYSWNLEKKTARETRYLTSLTPRQRFVYQLKRWLHGHRPWN